MGEFNKKEIREHLLNARDKLSNNYIIENSRRIIQNLESTKAYLDSRVIFCYVSYNNEVDTIEFIKNSINKKKICIPKVNGDRSITPYYISSLDTLVRNKFNILEPDIEKENIADIKDINIAVVPGVGFDDSFNRIGHGLGYYDKFFTDIKNPIVKIGLCFESQLLKSLPIDDFDVKMDMIITENRIIGGKDE